MWLLSKGSTVDEQLLLEAMVRLERNIQSNTASLEANTERLRLLHHDLKPEQKKTQTGQRLKQRQRS